MSHLSNLASLVLSCEGRLLNVEEAGPLKPLLYLQAGRGHTIIFQLHDKQSINGRQGIYAMVWVAHKRPSL